VQVVNIHARFTTWFAWGFINWLVPPMVVLISYVSWRTSSRCGTVSIAITGCWGTCSFLIWFIMGIAWRFNYDGMFSSGTLVPAGTSELDWEAQITAEGSAYQVRSGSLMKSFFVTLLVIFCLNCVFACLTCAG